MKGFGRWHIDMEIEGNTLFVDGSGVRTNASINKSWTKDRCVRRLEKIDTRIAEILSECEQADQTLGHPCKTACADSGYSNIDELEKVDHQDIKVVVPSTRQASDKEPGPFDKSHFKYDSDSDSYICPAGKILRRRRINTDRNRKEYLADTGECNKSINFVNKRSSCRLAI